MNPKERTIPACFRNTSAIGWIFKSGKVKKESKYYRAIKFIAQTIATNTLLGGAQQMQQHLRGRGASIMMLPVANTLSFAGKAQGKTCPLTLDEPKQRSNPSFPCDANLGRIRDSKQVGSFGKKDPTWQR